MRRATLRNMLLIARREYLETVRTKAFIIMTLLTPAIMFGFGVVPSLLATMRTGGDRTIVVVAPNEEYASAIKNELERSAESRVTEESARQQKSGPDTGVKNPGVTPPAYKYKVETSTDLTDAKRKELQGRIDSKAIDGFLWLDEESLKAGKMSYTAKSTNDFIEMSMLRNGVRRAITSLKLSARGIAQSELNELTRAYEMETISWEKGQARKSNQGVKMMSVIFLTLAMYMTVLIYGISVMRAVLEEKKSRIMEVMMSAVTSTDLMAGKIIGVGAVGITQIAIWGLMGAVLSAPGLLAMGSMMKDANIGLSTLVYFAIFFVLGYILYSALCAAIGAMVNSEQEAQQLQFIVMLPMIVSMMMMMLVLRIPNSPIVTAVSLFPFCTPLVMYMRIIVEEPPMWQILLSILFMVIAILGTLWVAGRIYRVGVLMYGKKPTLPEIVKWIRYA